MKFLNETDPMVQDTPTWYATLTAVRTDNMDAAQAVVIGVDEESLSVPAPALPDSYSLSMRLLDDTEQLLETHIQQKGDPVYHWILTLNPHGDTIGAEPACLTLTWNPDHLGKGQYRLLTPDDQVLVSDMKAQSQFVFCGDGQDHRLTIEYTPRFGPAPPDVTPPSGTYTGRIVLTLIKPSDASEVRYTLDGTDPMENGLELEGELLKLLGYDGDVIELAAVSLDANGVCGETVHHTYLFEGDPLPDADEDWVPDATDNCPDAPNYNQEDTDTDGVGDVCDNCPDVINPLQEDMDENGVGDVCDIQADRDEDTVLDFFDNCPDVSNPGQEDTDGDGIGDACDTAYGHGSPVPDTGQEQSYTDTFGEDSDYTINPQSYTKLDEYGNELPDDALIWVMVRDNVTGLIWEVKGAKDGVEGLRQPE